MPVTTELARHFEHGAPRAHLGRRPLGRPGGEQAALGRDAVVAEGPGPGPAPSCALHTVLLPGQAHRGAVDGQVHVAHDWAVFDQGALTTARAEKRSHHLLDQELDVGASALVVQDTDVFEPYPVPRRSG